MVYLALLKIFLKVNFFLQSIYNMPEKQFTSSDGTILTINISDNPTREEIGNAIEKAREEQKTNLALTENTSNVNVSENIPNDNTNDSPEVSDIAKALTAELTIAASGQAAGAASGIGYIPIAFASGYAGSAVAQEIEGREDFSYGRAITSGIINLIPFSSTVRSVKAAAKVAEATGKTLSKGQIASMVTKKEALRGSLIGAGESVGTQIIDEGDVELEDVFIMAAGGGVLGGTIGRAGLGVKNVYDARKTKKVFQKMAGKTPDEIDEMVAKGEISPVDIANASPIKGKEGLIEANKIAEKVKLGVYTKAQVDMINRINAMQQPTSWENLKSQFLPSTFLGRKTTDAVFYSKNIDLTRKDISTKIATTLNTAIKKDPAIEKHIDDYLGDPKRVMTDRLKEVPEVEGALRKFDSELKEMQIELTSYLDTYKIKNMPDIERRATSQKIKNNDAYLTEEYELFSNPDYIPSQEQFDNLAQAIANRKKISELKKKKEKGIKNPNIKKLDAKVLEQAKKEVDKLFNSSANKIQNTAQPGSNTSLGILKEKKDFTIKKGDSDVVKEYKKSLVNFLNPITSPVERIRGTLNKVSTLVSDTTSDINIMNSLLQTGMAKRAKDIPSNQRSMYELLVLKRDVNNAKLENEQVYVPIEIQKALDASYIMKQQEKSTDFLMKNVVEAYNAAIGVSKAVLVIFNPPSYAVNAYGAATTMLGMGMNPFSKSAYKGAKAALAEYDSIRGIATGKTAESNEAYLNLVSDLKKYGLASGNVDIGDLRSSIEKGSFTEKINNFIKPVAKAYQASDIAARFSVWSKNQERLSKIFPDLKGDDLKLAAAKLTNDTFQNYDKISQSIRTASRLGGLPPFIAFTAEFSRNMYFQAKYAGQMIRGTFGRNLDIDLTNVDLNKMRQEGLLRLGALATVVGGTAGAISYLNQEEGISPDMEAALDDVVSRPYEKGKQKSYFNVDFENKTASSINPSYLVPHQIVSEAVRVGFADRPMDTLGDFLTNNLIGGGNFPSVAIAQAVQNEDKYNQLIATNEEWYKNAYDRTSYVVKEILRSGAQREIEKGIDIFKRGEDARYSWSELGKRQLGIRIQKNDWTRQAVGNTRDVVARLRQNATPYKRAIQNNPNMSQQERVSLFNQTNESRKASFANLIRKNKSLETLGFDEDERISIFKKAGLSSKDILAILNGRSNDIKYDLTKSISEEYEENYGGKDYYQVRKELRPLRKEDPVKYEKLVRYAKQIRKNERLDVTGQEGLIKNMSVEDRADLIMKSTPDEIQRYKRLGIITSSVRKEIRSRSNR